MIESAGMSVKTVGDRQVVGTGVEGKARFFEVHSDMLFDPVGEAAGIFKDPFLLPRDCLLRIESRARAARGSTQREVDVEEGRPSARSSMPSLRARP